MIDLWDIALRRKAHAERRLLAAMATNSSFEATRELDVARFGLRDAQTDLEAVHDLIEELNAPTDSRRVGG